METTEKNEFIINPRIVPCPRCELPIARWGAVMVTPDRMLAVVACDLCSHWGEAKADARVRGLPKGAKIELADHLCRHAYKAAQKAVDERHWRWRDRELLDVARKKLREAWDSLNS